MSCPRLTVASSGSERLCLLSPFSRAPLGLTLAYDHARARLLWRGVIAGDEGANDVSLLGGGRGATAGMAVHTRCSTSQDMGSSSLLYQPMSCRRCSASSHIHRPCAQLHTASSSRHLCRVPVCKKLVLRGDEPPTNLHAAERQLILPRQTCTITDDNRDTIFVNEVQPKPTSPGHDYGRSSPTATPVAPGSRQYAAFPRESVAMSSWLRQQPPPIFIRRLGLHSMTRTLPYTAKYNSSPIVTGLYKYLTQYRTQCAHRSTSGHVH
jgi:hypothetical protein